MVEIKEMPYSEKYAIVMDAITTGEEFMRGFVGKHLGEAAMADLESMWQEGIKPVPNDASDEEKYEAAYGNFMWIAGRNFAFIRSRIGEEGIASYQDEEVELLKKKNGGPAMLILKLLRAVAPAAAFTMTAKQTAYNLQWITPFSTDEITGGRATYSIPGCKVLDYPETDDVCAVACQRVYPRWFAEQFGVEMKFDRQGNNCTCILTPLP